MEFVSGTIEYLRGEVQDVSFDLSSTRLTVCAATSIFFVSKRESGGWVDGGEGGEIIGGVRGVCEGIEDGEWNVDFVLEGAHDGPIWKADWAAPRYGLIVASCSEDRTVAVWTTVASGDGVKWTNRCRLRDAKKGVMDVRFSPTQYGLKLASCSEDGMLRVYDAQDFSEFRIWTLDQQIAVSPPPSSPLSSPFPPSSPYRVGLLSVLQLGSGGGGCVVDVCGGDKSWGQGWCGKPGVCGGCVSLDWLDGREDVMVIAVATGAGMLQVWGRSVSHHHKWILLQQTQKPAHWGGCKHVAWSPRLSRDHDMLCTCGGEPAVMLWAWHLSESDAELLCEAGRWSSGFLHGSSQSLNAMECPSSPEDNTSESPPSQHNPRQQGQGNEGVKPTASATDSDVTGLSSIDLGDMPGAEEDGRQQGMSQSHETQYEITGERDKQLQALRNMCKDQLSLQALPCQQQHAVDGRGNREGVVIVQEQKTVDAADELFSQSSRHHDNLSSPSTPPLSPPHPTPIPSLPPSNPPPSSLPSSLLRSPQHILPPHPPALT
eukprot:GHVQ01035489.1.p1 GENE.GHVQ01035489.1~~GHVQ01035489.1.p1  ORF type:complete len:544 (+),score=126.19 GHVQ01035489.1:251-1882(+)